MYYITDVKIAMINICIIQHKTVNYNKYIRITRKCNSTERIIKVIIQKH